MWLQNKITHPLLIKTMSENNFFEIHSCFPKLMDLVNLGIIGWKCVNLCYPINNKIQWRTFALPIWEFPSEIQ
jgi:hypothetical protein